MSKVIFEKLIMNEPIREVVFKSGDVGRRYIAKDGREFFILNYLECYESPFLVIANGRGNYRSDTINSEQLNKYGKVFHGDKPDPLDFMYWVDED